MNSIYQVLPLLNKAVHSELERNDLQKLLKSYSVDEIKDLMNLAKFNACHILTYLRLKEYDIPADIILKGTELLDNIRKILNENERRNSKIKEFLTECQQRDIEIVLLKGALFSRTIYPFISYKKMNDLDFLVDVTQVEKTRQCLEDLKYSSVGELFGEIEDPKKTHHSPPYVSDDLDMVTGIHWGLVSPYSPHKVNIHQMLERKAKEVHDGIHFYRLSWEDNLIHLCIHLPYYKIGLRELADVSNLVLSQTIDWEYFLSQVDKCQAYESCYRVLSLAKGLINFDIPTEVLEDLEMKTPIETKHDTKMRLADKKLFLHSRSTYLAKIEKYFVIFQLTKNPFEKLFALCMMWKMWWWCPSDELYRINGRHYPALSKPWAKVNTAPKIFSAMARDHGFEATAAMTLINVFKGFYTLIMIPFTFWRPGLKKHPHVSLLKRLE
jgi:hypothetical protein